MHGEMQLLRNKQFYCHSSLFAYVINLTILLPLTGGCAICIRNKLEYLDMEELTEILPKRLHCHFS